MHIAFAEEHLAFTRALFVGCTRPARPRETQVLTSFIDGVDCSIISVLNESEIIVAQLRVKDVLLFYTVSSCFSYGINDLTTLTLGLKFSYIGTIVHGDLQSEKNGLFT